MSLRHGLSVALDACGPRIAAGLSRVTQNLKCQIMEVMLTILEALDLCNSCVGGFLIDLFRPMSILGDFLGPIQAFLDLISIPAVLRCMVKLERWKMHAQSGRAFAETTILGSMFCISAQMDADLFKGPRGIVSVRTPDVIETLFGENTGPAQVYPHDL